MILWTSWGVMSRSASAAGATGGLCPFHHEKTPSFSVIRDKQFFYCFGCKAGGNAANFLMKTEKVSFPEAVEMLARRAHMEMPQALDDKEYQQIKQKRQAIAQMNKLAAQYYFDTRCTAPQGAVALAYLNKRGVEEPIIRRFGLGLCARCMGKRDGTAEEKRLFRKPDPRKRSSFPSRTTAFTIRSVDG